MIREDWEFNILDVYNFRRPGPLEGYFEFVREHHDVLPGDLLEAGVFRGRALLGMALMLKELGSSKKIYGYDTWAGFPPIYSAEDALDKWQELRRDGRISQRHFDKAQLQIRHRSLGATTKIDSANISMSGDFSGAPKPDLEKKIAYFELDNVVLVQGSFDRTMASGAGGSPARLMAALIDADLYASYKVALPYIWPRLTLGGYVYLDEYYSLKFPGARIACDEFFAARPDKPQCHAREYGDFERWYVRKIFDAAV